MIHRNQELTKRKTNLFQISAEAFIFLVFDAVMWDTHHNIDYTFKSEKLQVNLLSWGSKQNDTRQRNNGLT